MILGVVRKSLGPYQLVRRLGRGGMAEVFLALSHGASGFVREVALKTLAPELVGSAELDHALIREAALAGKLRHRNLVAVLGLGVEDGLYYVVMEYVDGGDLRDAELPEQLALHVIDEVALGLDHLHGLRDERGLPLGVVHRDISPSNILVSTTGDVKLSDFGIARATALAEVTRAGVRKGKYAYMSPEQIAGDPITQASDQFALAVTLVELITGRRPYPGDMPWEVMNAITAGEPDVAGVGDDLVPIVRRALARDPMARFASVDELRRAIAPLRRGTGTAELVAWVRARHA
jgi:serine/threonine protein kinase